MLFFPSDVPVQSDPTGPGAGQGWPSCGVRPPWDRECAGAVGQMADGRQLQPPRRRQVRHDVRQPVGCSQCRRIRPKEIQVGPAHTVHIRASQMKSIQRRIRVVILQAKRCLKRLVWGLSDHSSRIAAQSKFGQFWVMKYLPAQFSLKPLEMHKCLFYGKSTGFLPGDCQKNFIGLGPFKHKWKCIFAYSV